MTTATTHVKISDNKGVLVHVLLGLFHFTFGGYLISLYFEHAWTWYEPLNAAIVYLLGTGVFCLVEAWKMRPRHVPYIDPKAVVNISFTSVDELIELAGEVTPTPKP